MTTLGTLVLDIAGLELTPEDREILAHPLVGGVIFFARNYASRRQIQALCQAIRETRSTPILIMVDQEGGRVQRFVEEFTRLPAMGLFGEQYERDPACACEQAAACGWLMAAELLTAGVDLSLAPVLDLDKGVSTVIGKRAFHADSQAVIQLAAAFARGMREAGMAATGKHFPGHGSVTLDSHTALPVDERTLAAIENDDMVPFAGMIQAGLQAVMAAHIIYPQIDAYPVGFSRYWLQTVLRDRLQFRGVIFSDDLNMEGANISANYADRVAAAREAGCDFTLLCNNRAGAVQALDGLRYQMHQVSRERWESVKGDFSRIQQPLHENQRWQRARDLFMNVSQQVY